MCGISALFAFRDSPPLGLLRAMTGAVRHRGPDDEGYMILPADGSAVTLAGPDTPEAVLRSGHAYCPRAAARAEVDLPFQVGLGHRRLSIVDLSPSGHQPMSTGDGRHWAVYNGEIYNHVELRQELEALGHSFASHSDTEVLLHAYREWGGACLHRFNGMFAFVLIDSRRRTAFVARDRFGVKPLYWWRSPSGLLAFASEIKQFSVLPGWSPRVNGQRAYDFLNWGLLDLTGETLFDGVFQVRGGECIECALDQLERDVPVRRWYTLQPQAFEGSFDEAATRFHDLFADSVRLRLRADVPVGSCLSGGLDSSSIVCVANRLLREAEAADRQQTFSACTREPRFDERPFIEEVVASTGVTAHFTYPDLDGLFGALDAIAWNQDEPFGSTSIYAQWNVFRLAAEHGVKVLLDGQGADESLAGYHGFFGPHFASLLRAGRLATLWREVSAVRKWHGKGIGFAAQHIANRILPESLRQPLNRLAGRASVAPAWLNQQRLGFRDRDPHAGEGMRAGSVNDLARLLLTATGVPMLLHWEDRNSMAHSIESRVPFLDYRLVEFLLGLPGEYKLHQGITKRVLRAGLAGVLPERIRTRMDKIGFATPEETWVRHDAPDLFRFELRRAIESARGAIRENALQRLESQISGTEPFSFQTWRMISFGRWMELFRVELPT